MLQLSKIRSLDERSFVNSDRTNSELKDGMSMPDRLYVKVTSDFDSTGYMQPRAILWPDGRHFSIDEIRSFRPAGGDRPLDCYTVIIHGQERRLFFERTADRSAGRLGRWFVSQEKSINSEF